jgi:ATP-dependent RNA helicase DeaD
MNFSGVVMSTDLNFTDLALSDEILKSLKDVGYEKPSPIQAQIIPHVLNGHDVLGQAQTGTGKTAAFALPILSKIDAKNRNPQVLVLAPTRELAIQVSEAFQKYAHYIKGVNVLPVYGGQDYSQQLRSLKRGVQIIVGTPGRVMDHMRRGTLKVDSLESLVLDEADEMLRMGFIDDVEWVLDQINDSCQIALFSATMPKDIKRIAQNYLTNPEEVIIKAKTATASTITQRCWMVSGVHKLDALTRILEVENFDAIIVFVRTKNSTVELSDKLQARGYSSSALNGDMAQKLRENTIDQLKSGKLDIIVATDVAARGLDVERISHVINYDIPYDTEAYVHRIGRTGRAGRTGDAILFAAPRERRMLTSIERATKQKIQMMDLPSAKEVNQKRIVDFKEKITNSINHEDKGFQIFSKIITEYHEEFDIPLLDIAAAVAKISQGDSNFFVPNKEVKPYREAEDRHQRDGRGRNENRRGDRRQSSKSSDADKERFRLDVGHMHGVGPGNIVGAVANEINISSSKIGRIDIQENCTYIDLPNDLSSSDLNTLKKIRISGQKINASKVDGSSSNQGPAKRRRR